MSWQQLQQDLIALSEGFPFAINWATAQLLEAALREYDRRALRLPPHADSVSHRLLPRQPGFRRGSFLLRFECLPGLVHEERMDVIGIVR